jgi:hypothetical protein
MRVQVGGRFDHCEGDLKNAGILLALFACVVGFLLLFGKSLERVSAGGELTPAEVVAGGGP